MKVVVMIAHRLFSLLLCALPLGAQAHEYWIEPLSYQLDAGDRIQAHFKNGEDFKGNSQSFFDRSSTRFDILIDGTPVPVTPRSGDSPALDIALTVEDKLLSVVHETTTSTVTYREWAKFQKFAAHKDFPNAEADHIAAGWSQVKFREIYSRHIKALIAVGNGAGNDSGAGLKTEFVALSNPYADGFDGTMEVMLYLNGAPRPDAQVEVFARAPDDSVDNTLHRTDADGKAVIPVSAGHEYLFDAVVLHPAADANTQENAIVWQTYWAALTFAVPE